MKVFSIINYKGGVGKTTITSNLIAGLAERGYKVLAIDMDPQCSLTFSFIRPEDWQRLYEQNRTIKEWFKLDEEKTPTGLEDLIIPLDFNALDGSIDLISSHLGLINVDLELATQLGGASMRQARSNFLKVHNQLLKGLQSDAFEEYDAVIIDCPPNFNIVTKNAIVASDAILIPAKPDYLSTMGIDYLRLSLEDLVTNYNEYVNHSGAGGHDTINPEILGVVFTMVSFYDNQPISNLRPYIRQTAGLGLTIFDSMMRENKSLFSVAPEYGEPPILTHTSNATFQRVIDELNAIVDEFIQKSGL